MTLYSKHVFVVIFKMHKYYKGYAFKSFKALSVMKPLIVSLTFT